MSHPKGLLIERAQKLGLARPEFDTAQTGPEHEPSFLTDVTIDGELLGTGQGSSKREAERSAAQEALAALDRRDAQGGAKGGRGKQAAPKRAAGRPQPPFAPRAASAQAEAPAVRATGRVAEPAADGDEQFAGPWPMFDELLAGVVTVAERRVNADLRGDAALAQIRDFSLRLYKELLADLGEVVEEEEDEEEEDED